MRAPREVAAEPEPKPSTLERERAGVTYTQRCQAMRDERPKQMALDNCKLFKPQTQTGQKVSLSVSRVGPILSKLLAQPDFQLFQIAFNPFWTEGRASNETALTPFSAFIWEHFYYCLNYIFI